MAWVESHTVLIRHRKTVSFALQLKIKPVLAVGHLSCLWHSVLEQAEDGDISKWLPGFTAVCACWEGDAEIFVQALKDNGWLDNDGKLHDWIDYAGKYLESKYRRANNKLWLKIKQKYMKPEGKNKAEPEDKPGFSPAEASVKPGYLPREPREPREPNLTKNTEAGPASKKNNLPINLPDWINKATWDAYLEMRKQKKSPPTEHAVKLILNSLEKLHKQGQSANTILEQSIMSGWTGVYPIKAQFGKNTTGSKPIAGKYDGVGEKI